MPKRKNRELAFFFLKAQKDLLQKISHPTLSLPHLFDQNDLYDPSITTDKLLNTTAFPSGISNLIQESSLLFSQPQVMFLTQAVESHNSALCRIIRVTCQFSFCSEASSSSVVRLFFLRALEISSQNQTQTLIHKAKPKASHKLRNSHSY